MALQPLPEEIDERTVPALLARAAREQGDATALIAPGLGEDESHLTYAELERLAGSLAAGLAEAGVGRGDRVAIMLDPADSLESHLTYHASHRLGAINVPVNTLYVERELAYVLGFVEPAAIVFSARFEPVLARLAGTLGDAAPVEVAPKPGAGARFSDLLEGPEAAQAELGEDEDADWIFTSGTTGNPKAVALTHANSVACGHQAIGLWGLSRDSVYQSFSPFFTSTGCHTNLLSCLAARCTYVIEPAFDATATLDRVQRHSTTSIFLISGALQLILDRIPPPELDNRLAASSLARIAYGGQPMPAPFHRRVAETIEDRHGIELVHLWGLTEGGTCGTLLPPEQHRGAVELAGRHGLSIGSRGFNDWVSFRVAGEQGGDAAPGEVGEICVRSPSVMDRYVDEPVATAAALKGGWLHTGDMGMTDETGLLYFVDRAKQMIRRGGLNISSAEVEGVLCEHPAVAEAAVVPKPNPVLEQEVKAVVVLRPGAEADAGELIEHCRELLADYKVPVEVVFTDALPRNAMGRVVKGALTGDGSALQP